MNKLDVYAEKARRCGALSQSCILVLKAELLLAGQMIKARDNSLTGWIFYDTKTQLYFKEYDVLTSLKTALMIKFTIKEEHPAVINIYGPILTSPPGGEPFIVALQLDMIDNDLLLTSQLIDAFTS